MLDEFTTTEQRPEDSGKGRRQDMKYEICRNHSGFVYSKFSRYRQKLSACPAPLFHPEIFVFTNLFQKCTQLAESLAVSCQDLFYFGVFREKLQSN